MDLDRIKEKLEKNFDGYEIFYLKERSEKYESRDLDIYSVELKEEEGIAVRAIKDKKLIFSYSYELDDKGIEKLISSLRELIPYADEDEDYTFSYPAKDYPALTLYDNSGLELEDRLKRDMIVEFEHSISSFDKRIVATRGCEFIEEEVEVKLLNSNGVSLEGKKTVYVLTGMAVAKDNDEVSWYDWDWSFFLKDLNFKRLGIDIARKAISFLGSTQIDTGIYTGILKPQAACDILGILSGSFLGENLFKNKTKLKDKLGKKCFSDVLNISDSGLKGINAFFFDGEGHPVMENTVVNNGVFSKFLFDNFYGKKLKSPSTGNSVRASLKEPPRCGIRGLYVEKGAVEIDDSIDGCVIIEELIGTHTANPVTGDFSLGAIGYVRKGDKLLPFKEVIFSGNIFELFNNVIAVGRDLKFYGSYGSPSLLIEGIKISGR